MLILRRKKNQVLVLIVTDGFGKETRIEIMMTDTSSNNIGVGIAAPKNVAILRKELEHEGVR